MSMYDTIWKKRNGGVLSAEEIRELVQGYTDGGIPDYQMAAFLMAVYFQGLDARETYDLTMTMRDSGDCLDLSEIPGIKVDKHSTGGIGDKTTLILAPVLAALGIPVAKMSGRGLGYTGGTIDKLESIPGFRTGLSREDFCRQVHEIGLAIAGQTANLAPADKKLYALRDVTATVDISPLIASSIMSKKLASGADVIVLDVKTGSGAFMQTQEEAETLARAMLEIGRRAGKTLYAVVTDMNEPLGHMVGNALEVWEAIEALRGRGEQRLMQVTLTLAAYMVLGAGKAETLKEAQTMAEEAIASGAALDKLEALVRAQGGDPTYIEHSEQLLQARILQPVYPRTAGYLTACRASEVGMAARILGAGRQTKDSVIDHMAGIQIIRRLGDRVTPERPFACLYGSSEAAVDAAEKRLLDAYTIGDCPPELPPVVRCAL